MGRNFILVKAAFLFIIHHNVRVSDATGLQKSRPSRAESGSLSLQVQLSSLPTNRDY